MAILDDINLPDDIKKLDTNKLKILASEIRRFLVKSVSKTGGHLASNLGVVELTLALHKVFNLPEDAILWDVGHQSYIHKILTGRKDRFDTLRQFGGLSGFPRTAESEYDPFDMGHSSTSISAALGFAHARDMKGGKNSVVAVIGDGSMTGGLAYEGLNNAGRLKTNFIVVLNNNEMSIAKNVGSMSKYLNQLRTGKSYINTKKNVSEFLDKIPVFGSVTSTAIQTVKDSMRHLLVPRSIFEELGFTCIGPVDGHDIEQLTNVLLRAKEIPGPVMLHVYTKKGKGYNFAESNPGKFHGIGKFDEETGNAVKKESKNISCSKAFGSKMIEIVSQRNDVVAITAAMPSGTGLTGFSKKFPDRFFDVGIAEQHAVTFAGGLAKNGFVPVVAIYSTFLQRAYDEIFHDTALQNLHVVFALDRAGLVGEDGETHHGIFDFSYLSHIPNMTVLAPCCVSQMEQMLDYAVNVHKGPIAVRYPKEMPQIMEGGSFEFGKAHVVRQGSDVTLISAGNMLSNALEAAELSGKSVEVIDVRTVKPLDTDTILKSVNKTGAVITLEDNVIIGGLGSAVESCVSTFVTKLGYGDKPVTHGSIRELYRANGVDANSVAEVIRNCERPVI